MGARSRNKGKRGERESCQAVLRHLCPPGSEVVRAAQVSGRFSADIVGVHPRIHVEVKRLARIPATDFMVQAVEDAKKDQIPVVLFREDGGGVDDWMLMVRLKDAREFAEIVRSLQ